MFRSTKIALVFSLLILFGAIAHATKLEKAFEALRIYDYFLAKKLFLKIQNKKSNAYASYGLSIIYSRNDNPFSNTDSAGKYIRMSYHTFLENPVVISPSNFTISHKTILDLADTIANTMFKKIKQTNTVSAYDFFLENYYIANKQLINEAVLARDELEYNKVTRINTSKATYEFLILHPQSEFYNEALIFREHQIYEETTQSKTAESYIRFIKKYPTNCMVNVALENLFNGYAEKKNVAGLSFFVRNYPSAHQTMEGWKLLFSLTVRDFTISELERFCSVYPEFPLKSSILYELELNKLVLFPYHLNDYSGFINAAGKFVIRPVYDAVTDFYEGLSVATKNDSVYFINKKNQNPFGSIYKEAFVFRNGIAPVKQFQKWCFINRQGQIISKEYDEINELRDQIYVVRVGEKYGALDHYGKALIEPKFNKLGDFKNGYAYYSEKGHYGFVSKDGIAHKAEFDWISDFNKDKIAIFQRNNKYGLVNSNGAKLLEPEYDLILKSDSSLYILVSNNLYGFFSINGCFLTPVTYDFQKDKSVDYYTNGTYLRLIKGNEQAFVDQNGKIIINFGAFQEINFSSCGRMRVKQKNKFGYLDTKLNLAIAYKYFAARDFEDSLALVKYKDLNLIINTSGSEVFSSSAEIVKLSTHYFIVNDDLRSVINQEGEMVYSDLENVQKVNDSTYLLTLNNGEIKLLVD